MKPAVDIVLRGVIVIVFAVLVGCVSWQVFSRYALGTPSVVTDEVARFLFMWLALIGGAYTYGARRHLAVDLMAVALTGRARLVLEAVILAVVMIFAAVVMVWGGYSLVSRTLSSGQVTPALRISMGWIYAAIPFAGIMIVYYSVLFFAEVLRGRMPEAEGDVALPLE